ncbi:DUF5342 family protein [Heyndrickxia sporothermodurans]|uniref:DUF5342 family protein n=1 Tax=Heyndrickxia sporothermodurans TaxID=46224 RepID=UPI000D3ABF35|nr:DUF5342 family protein [Heyndrickxia sporothermodurans]PTY81288.1 hypothetical protein B5V90_20935 [Heyndrickxia sporothermodurans]
MIQHFKYKSLYKNQQLPGWYISFYHQKEKHEGVYHPDGKIEWTSSYSFDTETEKNVKKQIHELMLYHVYDNR